MTKECPSCSPHLSVRNYVRYLVSASTILLAFHDAFCRYSLQIAIEWVWVWRLWTLERAFFCNVMHRETLSILELKNAYIIWRSEPIVLLLPEILIAFSAAGCTAGSPFQAGDKFLGTPAKFQKATISFVMLAVPSVRMKQFVCYWADFQEIWYFRIFRKYFDKIQISLKSEMYNRHFTWRPIHSFVISRSILLLMENV